MIDTRHFCQVVDDEFAFGVDQAIGDVPETPNTTFFGFGESQNNVGDDTLASTNASAFGVGQGVVQYEGLTTNPTVTDVFEPTLSPSIGRAASFHASVFDRMPTTGTAAPNEYTTLQPTELVEPTLAPRNHHEGTSIDKHTVTHQAIPTSVPSLAPSGPSKRTPVMFSNDSFSPNPPRATHDGPMRTNSIFDRPSELTNTDTVSMNSNLYPSTSPSLGIDDTASNTARPPIATTSTEPQSASEPKSEIGGSATTVSETEFSTDPNLGQAVGIAEEPVRVRPRNPQEGLDSSQSKVSQKTYVTANGDHRAGLFGWWINAAKRTTWFEYLFYFQNRF